jgi:putative DNA primase/helicase
VKLEPVKWLWQDWLAAGKLHIVAGPPGTGKTTICIALAATISCGGRWADGTSAERGSVLIWSGEDDPADTLAPRLKAAGADLSRVHFVRQMLDSEGLRPFDPAQDMAALVESARNLLDLRLLILDPIVNAVGGDSHKNTEVRRALAPVVDLAASLRVAAIGISHFSKGTQQRDPVERVTGSLAFGALPRVVMAAVKVKTEDGSDSRLLARAKSNIGKDDGGFAYSLEQVEIGDGIAASRVKWGTAVEGSARELLADADNETDGEHQDAAVWLRELLIGGPIDSNEVKRAADANGISWSTLRRAKKRIGAKSEKDGMTGGWSWFLPEDAHEDAEDAQQKGVSTFGKPEHLRESLDDAEVF